jgi:uncharacterized protein
VPQNLVDTGALIAFVDRNERRHRQVRDAFASAPLPLVATQAVLTETFYFAQRIRGTQSIWDMVLSGAITVAQIEETELRALHTLMTRYADRPMDFADATLVHVAGRENISTILTIDHDDFETYRFGRNRKFKVLPPR